MNSLPPTPPFHRTHPLNNHPNQISSPLNPASSPHPISIPHRLPGNGFSYARKSSYNSPNTPTRFLSPRTPLSFLSQSPTSSSNLSCLSTNSSIGWQLRTPTNTANSASLLPLPSPASLPPSAELPLAKRSFNQTTMPSKPHNVKIPRAGLNLSGEPNGSPSYGLRTGRPSPLDNKLAYLQSIPASPPIMIPSAQLLVMYPTPDSDEDVRHSIASSFVNLKLSPSPPLAKPEPVSAISPLLIGSRRTFSDRRASSLSNEINELDFKNDTACLDNDNATNATARVPKPNPASPAISCTPTPTPST